MNENLASLGNKLRGVNDHAARSAVGGGYAAQGRPDFAPPTSPHSALDEARDRSLQVAGQLEDLVKVAQETLGCVQAVVGRLIGFAPQAGSPESVRGLGEAPAQLEPCHAVILRNSLNRVETSGIALSNLLANIREEVGRL